MQLRREALTMLVLAALSACDNPLPQRDISEAPPHVHITSLEPQRGVPTLLWSQSRESSPEAHSTPEAAASWYLERLAPLYHLGEATLRTAAIHQVHDTGRGGILVSFRQRVEGIEVLDSKLEVLLTRDLQLVAVGGNLQEADRPRPYAFRLSHGEAVAHALGELSRVAGASADLRELEPMPGGFRAFALAPGRAFDGARMTLVAPARTKRVLFPRNGQLVPAYYVETNLGTDASNSSNAEAFVVSAEDGAVLRRQELTHADSFEYRVWAEADGAGTPLDGPQADYTPHPSGTPDGTGPAFIPPRWVSMEGFNGRGDVWLPPGATESRGNNVDAYADLSAPDGFTPGSDFRAATVPGSRRFDHVYDTSLGPLAHAEQTQAAVTQLFYTTNWLHDDFYVSGFDEAAGNAQASNFGRGGLEGDPLLAEAQGHEGSNNAFMSVPADGESPRMQVFIWLGPEEHFVEVSGQRYPTGMAFFGSQHFQVTQPLVLVNDGVAAPSTHDGCEAMGGGLGGTVVMIERGTCPMALKARNAEQAGASGVIILNNVPGAPPPRMTNDDASIVVKIPVLSVTYEDGERLVQLAGQQDSLTAILWRGSIDRDGSLDNTLVAHEWGHYLHLRLMSPCTTTQCLAMSEGWADFIALHMLLREGDSLEGSYALAPYAGVALGNNSAYFGIRRAPYSVNKGINDLSLRHISEGEPLPTHHPMASRKPGNSEIHNAGEIFASLLFEGYVALLRETRLPTPRYSFQTARRRMADYIVAAMKLAPPNATYTEQLQALLAVAAAQDLTDHALLAEAYARRGAGPNAIAPPRNSVDLTGVVEDFSVSSPGSGYPVAQAGPDQTVPGGRRVHLDASGSQAPKGGALTFQWHQVSGPPVVLEEGGKSAATFTAPVVPVDTVLAFRVTVGQDNRATVDTVEVRVLAGDSGPVDGGVDAGSDAGVDAGTPDDDAGTPDDDAGTDAGVEPPPPSDGGTEPDAGTENPGTSDPGCGCGAGSGAPHSTFLFALLAILGLHRSQRRHSARGPAGARAPGTRVE
ncbi:M36 family metallopeptidase [Archangium violaceum]|uniref:M36 family metallopeptidase n=1 Tax=Archangium violaceum TaxID=83451 RepID=UPI00193C1B84|nr:M36 family metallopeptidase [Archangium violaceum]QRK10242.1 M36 family metallopeptidase [Archangium violaceum]